MSKVQSGGLQLIVGGDGRVTGSTGTIDEHQLPSQQDKTMGGVRRRRGR